MTQAVSLSSSSKKSFPRTHGLDNTLALLHEGYAFISNRCAELGVDAFETRLGGRHVICMRGEAAARLFYGGGNFTRHRTTPPTVIHMLREKGSVEQLDGEAHHWRKAMFMSLMTKARIDLLVDAIDAEWGKTPDLRTMLCHAAARWIGLAPSQEMDDAIVPTETGTIQGLRLRHRAKVWAERVIEEVRANQIEISRVRPLAVLAEHRDEKGSLLVPRVAAVELLNLVRPIVSVARFVEYAVDAYRKHPVNAYDEDALDRFVQEVRRLYPLFPAVAGRALKDLTFRGWRIEKGTLVLFDLYGTNHDPDIWTDPNGFHPERFKLDPPTAFDLVPQGGGDYLLDHRCPGEPIAIAIMKRCLQLMTTRGMPAS
jgi:fatty-acid peroxygenase